MFVMRQLQFISLSKNLNLHPPICRVFSILRLSLIMQKQGLLNQNCLGRINARLEDGHSMIFSSLLLDRSIINSCRLKFSIIKGQNVTTRFITKGTCPKILSNKIKSALNENVGELYGVDEDDDLCPVECVREFKTDEELSRIMEKANESNALVVVDFYRTSCGSCKYIEQGFQKLCKGSGNEDSPVIFLKHNVMDEYDERSEVADRLRIRSVPLFHFYKNGVLLEAFATRDKERILGAISKYTASSAQQADSVM